MTDRRNAVAQKLAARLATKGAHAVALVGSVARGDAHEFSDIDLVAIGNGPRYQLEIVDDELVSISWRNTADIREAFEDPFAVGGVVPSWREARMLHDPNGVGASLQRQAHSWSWDAISAQCDRAVGAELYEFAEEVYRIVGLRRSGNRRATAALRGSMLWPLVRSMAMHHRILYDSENSVWDLVGNAMGNDWQRDFDIAAGVERGAADLAVLSLYRLAATRADRTLTSTQRIVVNAALAATEHAV